MRETVELKGGDSISIVSVDGLFVSGDALAPDRWGNTTFRLCVIRLDYN